MRAKIREVLDDCIAQGIDMGYHRAHKYNDFPSHAEMIGAIEDEIWMEIDRHFDFERNVCDEVVEGFDQLEKDREWVGLESDWVAGQLYHPDFVVGAKWAEKKLKEKNT